MFEMQSSDEKCVHRRTGTVAQRWVAHLPSMSRPGLGWDSNAVYVSTQSLGFAPKNAITVNSPRRDLSAQCSCKIA